MQRLRTLLFCVVAGLAAVSLCMPARAQSSFDRPGHDYVRAVVPSGDPADCALRCERDRRCKAWSFSYPVPGTDGAMCALKNNVPARVESTCCESGVRGAGVVEPRSGGIEAATDRPGGDYRHFDVKGEGPVDACRNACTADNKCRAWTYVRPGYMGTPARCYLKSRVTPPRRKPCCVSGVVR
ncbi:MAG: apple domain-containing protein [Xanthobacteraceae bacterium]|nr:MAG: apple domain-containing protein [Xanthobacteraceae bacterium]